MTGGLSRQRLMRITNSLLQQRVLRDLQGNMAALAQANGQISSGKRFERMSEDPVAGTSVLDADRGLAGITQYRRNSSAARARTDAEEAVLNQITDLLARAKELAVQEGSATSTTVTHLSAKSELDRIIEQVVQLGNTKVGDEYLFAGHLVGTQPFDASGNYAGDDGVRQAELGNGYLVTTNHTGRELLVGSGIIGSLSALGAALTSGNTAAISGTLPGLDNAFSQSQSLLASTGARSRQIDSAMQNSDALETNLTLRRSDAQDVDVAAATTRLMGVQTSLQASLLSASRIMNISLTDYLR